MKKIAMIGGGFSGSLVAVNLARFSEIPLHVTLINRGCPVGRGVAYSTKRGEHLLNVVARNMSALADQPNHFVDWLKTRHEYAETPESLLRETFIPRRIYGDYIQGLLHWHTRGSGQTSLVTIEVVEGQAMDIEKRGVGGVIQLSDGRSIEADKIVLATGNQPPADFVVDGEAFRHPHYCENPWQDWESRLPERHENVVLLGTGLTTVDAYLTLAAHDWRGTIFAVSRNGLLPQSHFRGIEYPNFPPDDPSKMRLEELVQLLESHCARLRLLGANPAIAVDKLRPHTQRIWQSLTLAERAEFVRTYSARWNVTRHRIASEIHRQLMTAQADGKLRIVTGTIEGLHATGSRIGVAVLGADGTRIVLEAGLVINGTGPQSRFSACREPLFRNLIASGMIVCDDLDMGIKVDSDFTVLGGDGTRSPLLFAIGPLLKGSLWETIAVPELRGQTLTVAQSLLDQLGVDEMHHRRLPVPSNMELLEYCI